MSPFTPISLVVNFLILSTTSILAQSETKIFPESHQTIYLTDKTPEWFLTIKYNVHQPLAKKPLSVLKDSIYPQASTLQPNTIPEVNWTARLAPRLTAEYDGGDSYATPNDDYLAVSASRKIVAVQNNLISVLDENGSVLVRKSLRAFSGEGTNDRPFDPRVLYDEVADRFILVFLTGTTFETNKIHLAFSSSSNPMDSWYHYSFTGNAYNDSSWNDFPAMALSGKYLYLTFNTFGNGSVNNSRFRQSVIWRIEKQKGYANAASTELSASVFQQLKYNGTSLFNLTPVINSPDTAMYFLSNHALTSTPNHNFFLLMLNNKASSPEVVVLEANLPYQLPPDANQKDVERKLNTNDSRIQDAVYDSNRISFVLNSARIINGSPLPASWFGQIPNVGQNRISGEFLPDTLETAFPSLTPVKGGFLFCYSHSSPEIYPGMSVIFRDNGGEYSKSLRVKAGSKNVSFWGDYNKIVAQPSKPNTFWLAGAYGLDVGTIADGELATTIARIELGESTGVPVYHNKISTRLFPNPISGIRFTLEFTLNESQTINISVYNLHAQKTSIIYSDKMPAGLHSVTISTSHLAPGTYFLKLEGERNFVSIKKFVKQ